MLKVGLAIRRIFCIGFLRKFTKNTDGLRIFRFFFRSGFSVCGFGNFFVGLPSIVKRMLPLKQGHENPEVLIAQISLKQVLEEAGRCQLRIKTGYLQWAAGVVSGGSTSRQGGSHSRAHTVGLTLINMFKYEEREGRVKKREKGERKIGRERKWKG